MSVTTDIIESWRRPRTVLRRHLARGQSEPFAFSLLVVFLILAFVAQWPRVSRVAYASRDALGQAETPVAPQMLAIGLALLATIPLWYGMAALSRLVAKVMGGQGSWYSARVALFWSLVAVTPLMLLQGLVAGMIGPGAGLTAVGLLTGAGFLVQWINALIETER